MKRANGQLATCILASVLVVMGCAAKVTPELVAARAFSVLELVAAAQESVIEAEANGLISEALADTALVEIDTAVEQSLRLIPLLEDWDRLSEAGRAAQLEEARRLVVRLGLALSATWFPEGSPLRDTVGEAVDAANKLLERLTALGGDL